MLNSALALSSYDDIFQTASANMENSSESIQEIPLTELHDFENHPFLVKDDDSMREMVESVLQYGVLIPGIVRPRQEGGYEIIAGHRRKRACELARLTTMPVIVRDLDMDESTIFMVDSNLQREKILPSEKAWAYRMKLEALNHRGAVADGIVPGTRSVDILVEQAGESKNQIFRYIRLTELVPGLLDMADEGKIALNPAVELSYLTRQQQAELLDCMALYEATPSHSQAIRLKKHSKAGTLTREIMEELMGEEKHPSRKITFTDKRLSRYFPENITQQEIEEIIIRLLDRWLERQSNQN